MKNVIIKQNIKNIIYETKGCVFLILVYPSVNFIDTHMQQEPGSGFVWSGVPGLAFEK